MRADVKKEAGESCVLGIVCFPAFGEDVRVKYLSDICNIVLISKAMGTYELAVLLLQAVIRATLELVLLELVDLVVLEEQLLL